MNYLIPVIMAILCLTLPTHAQAGLFYKLKAAAQDVSNAAKGKPQAASQDPDKPLHLEDQYKGSCYGKQSATCMDYGELADQCMAPLRGYRAKLTADLIEKKLKEANLSPRKRMRLEEDLVALREAEKNQSDNPTIDGKANSQRHLSDISEEDQVCINADYGTFYKKIYNKCIGADHMNTGKRTEMMQGQETLACEQAVAQYREKQKQGNGPMDCMKKVTGIRYQVMADMMEKKIQTLKLSDKERADWEFDIAAVRKVAQEGGTSMPQSNDPANLMRPMMRLTSPEEQAQLNNEYSAKSQAAIAECTKPDNASGGSKGKSNGLVDHSQSPSNKNAKKMAEKQYADLNKGRGGSTNLLALRRDNGCYDQLKGHMAKVTADKLESKLKSAGSIPDQKRKEWQEDIAAWRKAEAEGKDSPEPPDPGNPYRWQDYVTNKERQEINKEHLDFNNKVIKECGNRPSGL